MLAAAVLALVLVACGLGVIGTLEGPDGGDGADGSVEAPDASASDGAIQIDATLDATSPDAAPVPSNVPADSVDPNAASLTGIVAIDTTSLMVDVGVGLASPPAGITFRHVDAGAGGAAILSVGKLVVNLPIKVTGTHALVMVASGIVTLENIISINATGAIPGPGGSSPATGNGRGGTGFNGGASNDCGGGGAGHGAIGAMGGPAGSAPGGDAGAAYAIPLFGGSGGGTGTPTTCSNTGGAGGGALQIFSLDTITIASGRGINAGGGGGRLGCGTGGSGGGGGSGGLVLLEAPRIVIKGIVAANGGGGGGGGTRIGGTSYPGQSGEDGVLDARQANGGPGGNGPEYTGGRGASSAAGPQKPATAFNGGGGGGGVGRILLRTRAVQADLTGGVVTPVPTTDTTL